MIKLDLLQELLAQWGNREQLVLEALLLGSFAKGNADEQSDMDVACVLTKPEEWIRV